MAPNIFPIEEPMQLFVRPGRGRDDEIVELAQTLPEYFPIKVIAVPAEAGFAPLATPYLLCPLGPRTSADSIEDYFVQLEEWHKEYLQGLENSKIVRALDRILTLGRAINERKRSATA